MFQSSSPDARSQPRRSKFETTADLFVSVLKRVVARLMAEALRGSKLFEANLDEDTAEGACGHLPVFS